MLSSEKGSAWGGQRRDLGGTLPLAGFGFGLLVRLSRGQGGGVVWL